jgi:hypothetical protein
MSVLYRVVHGGDTSVVVLRMSPRGTAAGFPARRLYRADFATSPAPTRRAESVGSRSKGGGGASARRGREHRYMYPTTVPRYYHGSYGRRVPSNKGGAPARRRAPCQGEGVAEEDLATSLHISLNVIKVNR